MKSLIPPQLPISFLDVQYTSSSWSESALSCRPLFADFVGSELHVSSLLSFIGYVYDYFHINDI